MLGDLLAKEEPTLQDREAIRLEMNNLQQQVSTLSVLMDSTGNLDPNVFLQHSRGFSLLPHECAAMYTSIDQTIGDNSWTTLVYDSTSGATWNKGLEIDPATGRIYVTGISRETTLFMVAWATFVPNATGERHISWNADDGGKRYKVFPSRGAGEFDTVFMEITHGRRIASAQTYYYIQVLQDSGGNLDTTAAGFFVARFR